MRVLSGIQPSGVLHIGNYFGMIHPVLAMQESGDKEIFLFIADYHSLTTSPEPEELRQRIFNVAVDWLACGLDPEKTVFFRQSDIPQVTELTWFLNCSTSVGLLERAHSYKDKIANGFTPNNGLFSYPVLMAADILIYKSHLVPVGKDQKQHVEITRDIAQRFNNQYGEILVLPEPRIREEVAVVPGIDGRKMSKSYDNTIELFGNKKALRKKVMGIVTDSKPLEEPKDPSNCNVFDLYRLFASKSEIEEMENNYRNGNYGYGHAKQAFFDIYWNHFETQREKREELIKAPDKVEEILQSGAKKAQEAAESTMCEIRKAMGLR